MVLRASETPRVERGGAKVGPRSRDRSARSARVEKSELWLGVPLWTHFIGRASANAQRFHHQAPLKALHLRGVLDAHRGLFALLGRIERRAPLAARSGERRLLHRPRRVLALAFFLGRVSTKGVRFWNPQSKSFRKSSERPRREALSQARPPVGSAKRICADGGAAGHQHPPARRGRGGPGGAETRVSGPTSTRAGRASG